MEKVPGHQENGRGDVVALEWQPGGAGPVRPWTPLGLEVAGDPVRCSSCGCGGHRGGGAGL